jgi:hypothetical protein
VRGRKVENLASEDADRRRFQVFDALMSLFPPGKVIDLGAGHGKFARRASDMGWRTTAVDARTERFPDDPRVEWRHEDVRVADVSGYDLILCLGLFYHLTVDDQLDLLGRCAGTPLVIDTHLDVGSGEFKLTKRRTVRGYSGRFYAEPNRLTSAWGNSESFWPTPESFHAMLRQHGYGVVTAAEPAITPSRRFYLAIPDWDPVHPSPS